MIGIGTPTPKAAAKAGLYAPRSMFPEDVNDHCRKQVDAIGGSCQASSGRLHDVFSSQTYRPRLPERQHAAPFCERACALTVGIAAAFQGLAVHLPAILQHLQQLGDGALAHLVPHRAQRRRQLGVALRAPPQRSHRIALPACSKYCVRPRTSSASSCRQRPNSPWAAARHWSGPQRWKVQMSTRHTSRRQRSSESLRK